MLLSDFKFLLMQISYHSYKTRLLLLTDCSTQMFHSPKQGVEDNIPGSGGKVAGTWGFLLILMQFRS
jgi:hypothetical protein